jgi:hypothetical protein
MKQTKGGVSSQEESQKSGQFGMADGEFLGVL